MLAFARLDLERFGGRSKYTHARDILSDDLRGKHGDGGLEAAYDCILKNCRAVETRERFASSDSHITGAGRCHSLDGSRIHCPR
jgi:hypothetical protein